MTLSGCASPAPPPSVPARSMFTCVTAVPAKLFTTTLSAPPRAWKSTCSTPSRSRTTLPTLREKRRREPLAETSMISPAPEPLKSRLSAPACPSIVSLPSPGSHWKTSSPAPMKITSLPWLPSMKSLLSPPMRTSAPLLPRRVSSPGPPSAVIWIRAARLPVQASVSLPPLAFRMRFSLVPMSRKKGAGLRRSKRTRRPFAVMVKSSAPLPPFTSTVSTPSPPSTRSVSSPGFQMKRSWPAPRNAESSPGPPLNVSAPVPPISVSWPFPPLIVVVSVSVKTPLASSIQTRSSPAPALTTMWSNSARTRLKSAVPSLPTSTSRMPGTPARSRNASQLLAPVPAMYSVPLAMCAETLAQSGFAG